MSLQTFDWQCITQLKVHFYCPIFVVVDVELLS